MGSMRTAVGAAMLALGLMPGLAAGQDLALETSERLSTVGTWQFRASARDEAGRSVCEEVWTFRQDGTATVVSGEQVVEKRWRVAVDAEDLRWLHTASQSVNDRPDCTGQVDDPTTYPRPETGFVLLFFNSGHALTCFEPGRVQRPDAQTVQMWGEDTCWGGIAPLGAPPGQGQAPSGED